MGGALRGHGRARPAARRLQSALAALLILLALRSLTLRPTASPPSSSPSPPPAHRLVLELAGGEPPAVSSLTPLLASDLPLFLPRFLAAATAQLGCPGTQLLLAAYDSASEAAASAALHAWQPAAGCAVRLVRFDADPGLYETWDVLASHYALAPLLTSAALDDARAGDSLAAGLAAFRADPGLSVASFSVQPVDEVGAPLEAAWWGEQALPHGLRLAPSMLLASNASGVTTGGYNLPHSAPLWRAALHGRLGGFAAASQAARGAPFACDACCDWALFLRAALGGERLIHLSRPVGGVRYAVRASSHNRRRRRAAREGGGGGGGDDDCEMRVARALRLTQRGLYNNLPFHSHRGLGGATRRVALAPLAAGGGWAGLAPAAAAGQRLLAAAEWLAENGHAVGVAGGEAWAGEAAAAASAALAALGARPLPDPTAVALCNRSAWDATFVFAQLGDSAPAGGGGGGGGGGALLDALVAPACPDGEAVPLLLFVGGRGAAGRRLRALAARAALVVFESSAQAEEGARALGAARARAAVIPPSLPLPPLGAGGGEGGLGGRDAVTLLVDPGRSEELAGALAFLAGALPRLRPPLRLALAALRGGAGDGEAAAALEQAWAAAGAGARDRLLWLTREQLGGVGAAEGAEGWAALLARTRLLLAPSGLGRGGGGAPALWPHAAAQVALQTGLPCVATEEALGWVQQAAARALFRLAPSEPAGFSAAVRAALRALESPLQGEAGWARARARARAAASAAASRAAWVESEALMSFFRTGA